MSRISLLGRTSWGALWGERAEERSMRTWQLYGKYRRMIGELAQMPMPKVIWERQLRELMGAFETEVALLELRNVIALRSELCGQLEHDAICTTNTYA